MRFKVFGTPVELFSYMEAGAAFDRYTVFKCKKFSFGFHVFHEAERLYPPHDHYNDFLSVAVWGGYKEELWDEPEKTLDGSYFRTRDVFSAHIMRHTAAHRLIELHKPRFGKVTTFFVAGSRAKDLPHYFTRDGMLTFWEFWDVDDFQALLKVNPKELKARRPLEEYVV